MRDVARVLEVPFAEADRLAKMVPDPVMGKHVKLKDAIVNEPVPEIVSEAAVETKSDDVDKIALPKTVLYLDPDCAKQSSLA